MLKFLKIGQNESQRAKVSIEDIKSIKQSGSSKTSKNKVKVKKLILCQGHMFGEDDCLNAILNPGNPKPLNNQGQPSTYSITCDSVEGVILSAKVEDIQKILKNEKHII